jgi:CBS domain-containing protein
MARVKDILAKKGNYTATVAKNDTVLSAAREMNARRIGAVLVMDGDEVVGMFTERDILTRVVAVQADPSETLVGEVMSSPVVCCQADTDLEEVRGIMTVRRIRHMPVVDESGLAGVITSGDLMAYEVVESKETIKYLHQYIHGEHR